MTAIHAKSEDWLECRDNILDDSKSRPSYHLLQGLLDSNVDVLLYAGDLDLICNYMGIEDMLASIFPKADKTIRMRELDEIHDFNNGLAYMRIYNASHMVPFDNPKGGLGVLDYMLERSVKKESEQRRDGQENNRVNLALSISGALLFASCMVAVGLYFWRKRLRARSFILESNYYDSEKGKQEVPQSAPSSQEPLNIHPERPFSPEEMNMRFVHPH